MKRIISLFTLIFILFTGSAWGATWYVDPLGTDDASHGTGSGADAWLTPKYALTGNRISNGDTLILMPGTYTLPDGNWPIAVNGGGDITVRSYQNNAAGRAETFIQKTATSGIMQISSATGSLNSVTFRFISFSAANSSSNTSWIAMLYDGSGYFYDCDFDGNGSGKAVYHGGDSTKAKYAYFVRSTIHGFSNYFITRTAGTVANTSSVTKFEACKIWGITTAYFYLHVNSDQVQFLNNTIIRSTTANGLLYWGPPSTSVAGNMLLRNNIWVTTTGDTPGLVSHSDNGAQRLIANPTELVMEGNIAWKDSGVIPPPLIYGLTTTYQVPIQAGNYWFDPSFTNYVAGNVPGSDLTLAAGSLAAKRGVATVPATDLNGNAFAAGDVGCYANPAKTEITPITNTVAFSGDSITYGNGTGYDVTTSNQSTAIFAAYNPSLTTIAGTLTGVSGHYAYQNYWKIDGVMSTYYPSTVFLMIGINNLGTTPIPTSGGTTYLIPQIKANLDKIAAYGARPIWLGITSMYGNPPNNTDIATVNAAIEAYCATKGWSYDNVLQRMSSFNANWKNVDVYYHALTTDAHPNAAGHTLIASVADNLYHYRPAYHMADANYGTADPTATAPATYRLPITVAGMNSATAIPTGETGRTLQGHGTISTVFNTPVAGAAGKVLTIKGMPKSKVVIDESYWLWIPASSGRGFSNFGFGFGF